MKKLLAFVLGLALLPAFVSAQQTVPAGGTGLTSVPTNSFLAGFDTLHLRATSSPFFSLFSFGTATGTSATTTNLFSTNASTTNLFGTNIAGFGLTSCNGATSALTFSGTLFGCHTISAGSSASTTLLSDNNTFSGNDAFTNAITGSVTGNAGTATKLTTARTLAITGDLAYTSPSFDGSGNVTAAGTLATVNSNVGSFTNANITVNGKGLVTAASNGSAGSASSTLLTDNNGFSGLDTFTDLKLVTRSTTTQATTTNLAISNIASGNCLQTTTGGAVIGSGSACGSSSGGAAYPFQGAGNSTSTLVGFNAGLISSASSTFTSSLRVSSSSPGSDLFNVGTGGTTYLSVDSGGTLNGYQQIQFNGPTFAQFQDTTAGASMDFKTVAGTGDITFTPNNTRQLTLSNNGNSTFVNLVQAANFLATGSSTWQNFTGLKSTTTNATTSSLAITSLGTPAGTFLAVNPQGSVIATTSPVGGSGVTSITAGTGLTGGTITTTGTIALDLTAQNIFTGASTTFVGGVTLGTATATSATTTNLAISSVASKLLTTNGNGTVSGYGGASACSSNNFVTTISALGATTCGTSTISGVSLGGTLGALTATDATLTFSGSYTGATARTVGLNLGNANTWTALQTFSNANSLLASGSSTLQAFTFTNATGSAYQLTGTNNVPVLGIYSPAVNQMAFSTASTFRGLFDANGRFALGTSTPTFDLTVASTSPTLELNDTDGATNQKHLLMSYNSGIFAIGTSSDSTLTSTSTDLTLNPLGPASFSVGTTSTAAILNLGDNPNESGTASSTMSTSGKFQIDTYNNAGARVCVEITTLNVFTVIAGACTN